MILEMPHGVYNNDQIIDFRVEKLPISRADKQKLERAFLSTGMYGFSSRLKRWVKFTEIGTKTVSKPPKNANVLPKSWEKYAMIIRESKLRNIIREEVSGLLKHAYKELKLAGYNPSVSEINSDDDYSNMIARSALKLVHEFTKHGHSGFSAPHAIKLFDKLVQWENLTPLTTHRKEWRDVSEYGGEPGKMWQNRRNPAMFSEDGGKTWYNVDEKVVKEAKQIFKRDVMRITELRQIIQGVIKEELQPKENKKR